MAAATAAATGDSGGVDPEDFRLICDAIAQGSPTIVLGETGLFSHLPKVVARHHESEYIVALATYKGSGKKFFQSIAQQLDIPTTETKFNNEGEPTGEKDLTMDALKEEIALNCSSQTEIVRTGSSNLAFLAERHLFPFFSPLSGLCPRSVQSSTIGT